MPIDSSGSDSKSRDDHNNNVRPHTHHIEHARRFNIVTKSNFYDLLVDSLSILLGREVHLHGGVPHCHALHLIDGGDVPVVVAQSSLLSVVGNGDPHPGNGVERTITVLLPDGQLQVVVGLFKLSRIPFHLYRILVLHTQSLPIKAGHVQLQGQDGVVGGGGQILHGG